MTHEAGPLPDFPGRPVHKDPLYNKVGFLEGGFGAAVHEHIKQRYGRFDAVGGTNYEDGVVDGNNFYYMAAVNEVVRPQGLRTATLADLWGLRMRAQPEDYHEFLFNKDKPLGDVLCGLALMGAGEPNYELAGTLIGDVRDRQVQAYIGSDSDADLIGSDSDADLVARKLAELEQAGLELAPKMPVMIPIPGIVLETRENPPRLLFRLGESARIYHSPVLGAGGGYFDLHNVDENSGLPRQITSGIDTEELVSLRSRSGLYGICKSRERISAVIEDLTLPFGPGRILLFGD